MSIFSDGVRPLLCLESFSLAGNKIQDKGFGIIQQLVQEGFPSLKLLDLADCFISNLSHANLLSILTLHLPSGWPRIEEILFQKNLLSVIQMQELQHEFGDRPMRCKLTLFAPYVGIVHPLRYNLRDYGVDPNLII